MRNRPLEWSILICLHDMRNLSSRLLVSELVLCFFFLSWEQGFGNGSEGCWEPEISSGLLSVHLKACMCGQSLSGSSLFYPEHPSYKQNEKQMFYGCASVYACLCVWPEGSIETGLWGRLWGRTSLVQWLFQGIISLVTMRCVIMLYLRCLFLDVFQVMRLWCWTSLKMESILNYLSNCSANDRL